MLEFLARTPVTPSAITWLGFLVTVGAAVLIITEHLFAAGFVVLVAGFFDMLDGEVARVTRSATEFGAFYDSVIDRYSDIIILQGLMVHYAREQMLGYVVLVGVVFMGAVLTSYARARAEGIGVPLKEGLFTRFERVFILVVGLLFNQLTLALWVLAIFSNLTAVQRMYLVWRITGGEKGG